MIAAVCMVLSFTACENDDKAYIDEDVELQSAPIYLSATVSTPAGTLLPTRATHSESQYITPTVVPGDVGVHFIAVGSPSAQKAYSSVYTYSPSGSNLTLTSGSQPYFPCTATGQVVVVAWYPRSATSTGVISNFTVQTDQSTTEGYTASDLMTASTTAANATTTGKTIPLVFNHQMAQLQVSFYNRYSPYVVLTPQITVTGVYLDQGLTTKGTITVTTSAFNGEKYDVLVPPQTLKAGQTLLTFFFNGKRWKYDLPTDLELKAGNTYPIVCTLTAENLTVPEGGASGADPKTADAKAHSFTNE